MVRAAGFVPLESKLAISTPAEGAVLRGELVDRLRESAAARVVLITGLPGYGKTTLLRQWAEEDERPFAWLTLDDSDNDPATLMTYLLLALRRIEPVDSGILPTLSDIPALSAADASAIGLPRLGRMLRRRRRPFVLVLDDTHVLSSQVSWDVVAVLAESMPGGSQLAIAGRSVPPLPWSRLRNEGQLLEVGSPELRLRPVEATELLQGAGLSLPPEEIADLVHRTEGWAAGLYLVALARKAGAGDRETSQSWAPEDSVVSAYLREELLPSLSADEQAFARRSSILRTMSGALCDAVLQTSGSGERLAQMEAANLFVVSLDRHGGWYRFHNLFGEMLQGELQYREPATRRELHSRASRWYEEAGATDEAIAHAHAAGEVARAGRLIWPLVGPYLAAGRRSTVEDWIDGFSNEQVMGHSPLALAAAWCAVDQGRPYEHWVAAAETGSYLAGEPGETEAMTAAVTLLRALTSDGVTQMGAKAALAARLQVADDPWRSLSLLLQAVSLHLRGDGDDDGDGDGTAARALLHHADQLAEVLSMHSVRAMAIGQLAFLDIEQGAWDAALARIQQAVDVVEVHGLQSAASMGLVYCARTLMLARQGRVDEAKLQGRRALQKVALTMHLPAWGAVESRYLLARAQMMLGDGAAARLLLSEAQNYLSLTPDAVVLRRLLEQAWRQLESFPVGVDDATGTLTTAELRVLQFLPTHLSFEEIGRRLYVSRNTVKTQAIAAYRKLGVSSRTDAVDRAAALGMLKQ